MSNAGHVKTIYPKYAIGILIASFALSLAPFLPKAFNIDDPIFIWTAKHIHMDPVNFYNFTVNWNGFEMPMWTRNQNPPLVSYYIAAASYLVGWREFSLHLAMILPALAVVIGTYQLAKQLCSKPFLATIIGLMTPLFFVSATTVMSDVLMLSFWVWAVYLWISGIKEDSITKLLIASLFIAFSSLTKYFGISLIPLLLCYSLIRKRNFGVWLIALMLPVTILVLYQIATKELYGQGLLLNAVSYSASFRNAYGSGFFYRVLTLTSFIGGCLISVLLFVPIMWSKKILALSTVAMMLIILLLSRLSSVGNYHLESMDGVSWIFVITLSVFAYAGMHIIAIFIFDLIKNPNCESFLIFLWSIGTLFFAGVLNWSINARSILPLAPIFGIVVIRRIDQFRSDPLFEIHTRSLTLVLLAVLMAYWVTSADQKFADSARKAASKIYETYRGNSGKIWFQGHWGFQYYMESLGGKPIDFRSSVLAPGDILVSPSNNSRVLPVPSGLAEKIDEIIIPTGSYITILNPKKGAGFYSDVFGPLPYAIGSESIERYLIYRVK